MFPATYNPSLKFCILVPYYDPLIEYYTAGSGAHSSGRTEYRPDASGSPHRTQSLLARCSRPNDPLYPRTARSDRGATINAPEAL